MQIAQKVRDEDLGVFLLGLYPHHRVVLVSMSRWAYSKSGTSRDGTKPSCGDGFRALEWLVIYEEVQKFS